MATKLKVSDPVYRKGITGLNPRKVSGKVLEKDIRGKKEPAKEVADKSDAPF